MEDDDIIEIRSDLAEEVDDAVIHAIHTDGNCSTPQGFSPHTPDDDTQAEEDDRFGGVLVCAELLDVRSDRMLQK